MRLYIHDQVEYRPNIFSREKRFEGELVELQGDCAYVEVTYPSGRRVLKTVHRQWLRPLPHITATGEQPCRS